MKFNKKISSKRRTNRRQAAQLPLHASRKLLTAPLSKELRKSLKTRSAIASKDCKVKILTGSFKGVTGRVTACNAKTGSINVENAVARKANGREKPVRIPASNVVIIELSARAAERKAAPAKAKQPQTK